MNDRIHLSDLTINKVFNTDTNHPLIPNSQEYIYYKKYVSIHSEDRNVLKYPNASEFEIELPEDMLNVVSIRLINWTFPANYDTFSSLNQNVTMTFQINTPYNPNENGVPDILSQKIFEFLFLNHNSENSYFSIIIEPGFYNPQQMVTELTNKFNNSVTSQIIIYFNSQITNTSLTPQQQNEYFEALTLFNNAGGYNNFSIVYNTVSQKIWFGNICDGFTLTNETQIKQNTLAENFNCSTRESVPDFSNWGLPGYLGLTRCNETSISGASLTDYSEIATYNGNVVPRFFYGDVNPGDGGFWLVPNANLIGSSVHWIEADYKINLMGPAYMYMEIAGQNCIDETQPYNLSQFTIKTNETNGVVNSSFAKIAIPTTPISQWFDRDSSPYKFYYPPAERMRKLAIRIRYHNGALPDFGLFNYSFMLEFVTQLPQILRKSNVNPYPVLYSGP
jgi:hypothetical protein